MVGDSSITTEAFFDAGYQVEGGVDPAASGPGRFVYNISTVETDLVRYEVILSLGKSEKTFTAGPGGVLTAKVPPGKWTITVRGIGLTSGAGYTPSYWPPEILWAWGSVEKTITAGSNTVAVDMYPAAEAKNWEQLADAIMAGGIREEIILINGTITKSASSGAIAIARPIVLKKGTGAGEITMDASSNPGALFSTGSGGRLTIDGPTLRGRGGNTDSLVLVGTNTTLVLQSGTITGNNTSTHGGGVHVYMNGTFTMKGGTISGNTGPFGGGVEVEGGGIFTQSGGTISGNSPTDIFL